MKFMSSIFLNNEMLHLKQGSRIGGLINTQLPETSLSPRASSLKELSSLTAGEEAEPVCFLTIVNK